MAVAVVRKDFIDQGWNIRRKDVDLGEKLGKGQFGGNRTSSLTRKDTEFVCFKNFL